MLHTYQNCCSICCVASIQRNIYYSSSDMSRLFIIIHDIHRHTMNLHNTLKCLQNFLPIFNLDFDLSLLHNVCNIRSTNYTDEMSDTCVAQLV